MIETTDWYVVASLADRRAGSGMSAGPGAGGAVPAFIGEREAYFPELGGMIRSTIIDRYRMQPAEAFEGPCLIEERESTTVVASRRRGQGRSFGHLAIGSIGDAGNER